MAFQFTNPKMQMVSEMALKGVLVGLHTSQVVTQMRITRGMVAVAKL